MSGDGAALAVESRGGIAPPRAHGTGREPRSSSGSSGSAVLDGVALVMPSSHHWLVHGQSGTSQPLRSRSIPDPSSLLRVDPPLGLASVLRPLWGFHLGGSLPIEATRSQVPHPSPERTHAPSTPDATLTVSGSLQRCSRRNDSPRV